MLVMHQNNPNPHWIHTVSIVTKLIIVMEGGQSQINLF